MDYYKKLGLEKDPFSLLSNPEFFYRPAGYDAILKRLESVIRSRKGLSLILGDSGTGKTMLLNMLLAAFKSEENFIVRLIAEPDYKSEFRMLSALAKMFGAAPLFKSTLDFKESLEKYLEQAAQENKTVVLLVDKGQSLSLENLEVLRGLLNYEAGTDKLLQIVIAARTELLLRLKKIPDFTAQAALKYTINPLDETETREIIDARLKAAGYNNGQQGLFSEEALRFIWRETQGYPRRVVMLCRQALEALSELREHRAIGPQDIEGSLAQGNKYER